MDCAVDSTAASHAVIRSIDDDVDFLLRDVPKLSRNSQSPNPQVVVCPGLARSFCKAVPWCEAQELGIRLKLIDWTEQARENIVDWPNASLPVTATSLQCVGTAYINHHFATSSQ